MLKIRLFFYVFACNAQDKDSLLSWKKEARDHLKKLLGISRLEQIAADTESFSREEQMLESVQEDGYIRHKLHTQTLPGVFMPFICWAGGRRGAPPGHDCRAGSWSQQGDCSQGAFITWGERKT